MGYSGAFSCAFNATVALNKQWFGIVEGAVGALVTILKNVAGGWGAAGSAAAKGAKALGSRLVMYGALAEIGLYGVAYYICKGEVCTKSGVWVWGTYGHTLASNHGLYTPTQSGTYYYPAIIDDVREQ